MILNVQDLYRRAQRAAMRGYDIANGSQYAQQLGGTDGSPAGLVELCRRALASQQESEPVPAPPAEETAPAPVEVGASPVDVNTIVDVAAPEPTSEAAPDTLGAVEEPPAPSLAQPVEAVAEPTAEATGDGAVDEGEEDGDAEGEAVEGETTDAAKEPGGDSGKKRRSRRSRR
jgi:hypothetical protein